MKSTAPFILLILFVAITVNAAAQQAAPSPSPQGSALIIQQEATNSNIDHAASSIDPLSPSLQQNRILIIDSRPVQVSSEGIPSLAVPKERTGEKELHHQEIIKPK